ncbi:hypothetical protein D3C81_2094970 [compost metagenome]
MTPPLGCTGKGCRVSGYRFTGVAIKPITRNPNKAFDIWLAIQPVREERTDHCVTHGKLINTIAHGNDFTSTIGHGNA